MCHAEKRNAYADVWIDFRDDANACASQLQTLLQIQQEHGSEKDVSLLWTYLKADIWY